MAIRARKKVSISALEHERIEFRAEVNGKLDRIMDRQANFCDRLEIVTNKLTEHAVANDEYQKHIAIILAGDPADEAKVGFAGRIKNLENEKRRWDKTFWFITSTVTALALARVFEWFQIITGQPPTLHK